MKSWADYVVYATALIFVLSLGGCVVGSVGGLGSFLSYLVFAVFVLLIASLFAIASILDRIKDKRAKKQPGNTHV